MVWGRKSIPSLPTVPALEGLTDHFQKKGPVNCYPEQLHQQAGSWYPLGEFEFSCPPTGPTVCKCGSNP